jgi:N6-adenosine-specific RNA methylase IME4
MNLLARYDENFPVQFHSLAGIFPLLEGEAFAELVADIGAHGLVESIVLYEGKILDGRNRYRACQEAGVAPRFETYAGSDPLGYVVSLNLRRRHLTESQRAMVAARIATLPHGANQHSEGPSIEGASRLLNVGHASVERAKLVQREGAPELVQAVDRGDVKVSVAADIATVSPQEQREIVARGEREILEAAKQIRAEKAEVRRAERIERLVAISQGNAPLGLEQTYPIILADPPWKYEHPPMGATNRSIENHYPTMSLEEICQVPVSQLATQDAILFLWATSPKLGECMSVIERWGFTYRTCLVWVKDKTGTGSYVRNQHELLLIAKRGDDIPPPKESDRPPSILHAPRREHSRKPDEIYSLIEQMYPELARIELFARGTRPGWAAWGNQVAG